MSRLHSKNLTKHLRELSAEADTMTAEGELVTKAEALASLLWKKALGYEEQHPDDPEQKIRHKPENWAIQLIFERLEGRVPTTSPDEISTTTVADRVSDLAKARINALTETAATGGDKRAGPPTRKKTDE